MLKQMLKLLAQGFNAFKFKPIRPLNSPPIKYGFSMYRCTMYVSGFSISSFCKSLDQEALVARGVNEAKLYTSAAHKKVSKRNNHEG